MKARKWLVASVSLICLLVLSTSAFACACCAERGFYDITRAKPDKFYLDLLGEIKFDKTAELYMTEGEFEPIRGLDLLKADYHAGKSIDLSLAGSYLQRTWRVNIKTGNNRNGTLVLPMPAMMVRYKVDIHDSEGSDVKLYKEFFFSGVVGSGTGVFRSANAKPTAYTLVFQGRGNVCDNASDFTHWRLEINGKQAKYAFFGKLPSSGNTSGFTTRKEPERIAASLTLQ